MLVSTFLLSFHFVFNIVLSYNVATQSIFRFKVVFSVIKVGVLLLCLQIMPAVNALAMAWITSCLAIVPFLNLYKNFGIFAKFSVVSMQALILFTVSLSTLFLFVGGK